MELTRVDVLIVDDDDAIRRMLRRSLQRRGLICSEARDGVEALESLETLNCAVILLDLMMPRLDGLGFIERFARKRKKEQRPVVVAISASGEDQLEGIRGDEIHALVQKPFDVHQLTELVTLCVATRWAAGPAGNDAAPMGSGL